ncbi:MAG: response regulator, partial [Mariprofundaceae bacterium]|nr:response regulator [Mariprofundaceae bacterium]
WIYLSIRDNGMGIGQEQLAHVFDPFFSTKQIGEGTGLGLAMCYGAIQSHQGVIEVESELGKGCTFHIYLPLAQVPALALPKHRVGSSLQGKGETILLVDDDDSLRDAHQDVLHILGYKVIEARNGLEAVQTYTEQGEGIDLVIMDIVMPEMDGLTAAQHMLTMDKDINIFFATGYENDHSAERVLGAELSDVDKIKRLDKPFTVEKLSKMIRQALD